MAGTKGTGFGSKSIHTALAGGGGRREQWPPPPRAHTLRDNHAPSTPPLINKQSKKKTISNSTRTGQRIGQGEEGRGKDMDLRCTRPGPANSPSQYKHTAGT